MQTGWKFEKICKNSFYAPRRMFYYFIPSPYLYVLSLSGLNVNDTQSFARVLVLLKQLFLADKKLLTKIISIS